MNPAMDRPDIEKLKDRVAELERSRTATFVVFVILFLIVLFRG